MESSMNLSNMSANFIMLSTVTVNRNVGFLSVGSMKQTLEML